MHFPLPIKWDKTELHKVLTADLRFHHQNLPKKSWYTILISHTVSKGYVVKKIFQKNFTECNSYLPSASSLRKLLGISGCITSPPTENTAFIVWINHALSGANVSTVLRTSTLPNAIYYNCLFWRNNTEVREPIGARVRSPAPYGPQSTIRHDNTDRASSSPWAPPCSGPET